MACLPKLKCFKKEDGSDIQRSNDAKAAAAETNETKVTGRQIEGRMDHCAKWLRKVSAVTEYEESYLHSPKYLPPSSYLNNLNSNGLCVAGRRQSLCSQSAENLGHVSDKMAAMNIGGELRDDIKYPYAETSASSSDISSISSSIEYTNKRKKLRPRSGHAVSRHLAAQRRLSNVSDTTTESTFSLRTESVVLDLDKAGTNLGISIVGHRNRNGDQGIFVGTVRRDSVAFASGRIRPGSCLLEVNGQDLTKMSNENALRTVRTEAQKQGPLHLVLGKFWDVTSASKNEDFEESILEEAMHRPQEMAKLTYVQPNYCQPPRESQMVSNINGMAPPTYVVAPPTSALVQPISVQATPIHSSKPSNRARRRSDRMRNEPRSFRQMPSNFDDHSSVQSRRHSLPGILEPEQNFSEFLPVPPPIPPRPYYPGFECLSSAGGYSANLPYRTDSRGLALDSPQAPFRGIDLVEWIANRFSSHIGGISPRKFSQHLLEKGAIVDVGESGENAQFSENGYYVIVSSQLSEKHIVI